MSVSLETLVPQEEPVVVEEEEEEAIEEPPAPQEEEPPEAPAPQVIAPKKRGRPRKDPASPKKAAVKIKAPPPARDS